MADELKVRIETDKASFNELAAEQKRLVDGFKNAKTEIERANLSGEISKVNTVLVEQKKQLDLAKGGVGALHQDYIEFGTVLRAAGIQQSGLTQFVKEARVENRLQNFLLRESSQAVSSLSMGFGALTTALGDGAGATKALSSSLNSGINAFSGFDFAAKGLASSLGLTFGIGGVIAAGVAALTIAMVEFFGKTNEEAKKASEEGLSEFKKKLDELSESAQRATLVQLIRSQEELKANLAGVNRELSSGIALHEEDGSLTKEALVLTQRKKELEQSLLNVQSEIVAVQDKQDEQRNRSLSLLAGISEEIKQLTLQRDNEANSAERVYELTQKILALEQLRHKLMNEQPPLSPELQRRAQDFLDTVSTQGGISTAPLKKELKSGVAKGVPGGSEDSRSRLESTRDVLQQYDPLISSLSEGFARVGSTIQTEFIDKIIGATSLFQQFVGGVLSGIAQIVEQIAASAAIGGILSLLIPGAGIFESVFKGLSPVKFATGGIVNEPVYGIGKSGRSYMIGENGPERVAPLTNFSGGENYSEQHVYHHLKIAGRDLETVTHQNTINARKRGARR